ncbi:MAG: hypothetical protein EOO16_17195 [Chitinophagaceae bacterium]|nr:MAG: hypothetical protein EOO16_17195 [Chitinophagaceae bacterium]
MKPLFSFLLLCSLHASAQAPTGGPPRMTPEMKARFDSARARSYPPATADGISDAEFKAYTDLIDRHKSRPDAPYSEWGPSIGAAEREELLSLFRRMNLRQQLAQNVVFIKVREPKPRKAITEAELAAFRDSSLYDIVLDWRPAPNTSLAGLKADDIATWEVSEAMLKRAGSPYFTRRAQLITNKRYDADMKRYEQYKGTYNMVYQTTTREAVERPAN